MFGLCQAIDLKATISPTRLMEELGVKAQEIGVDLKAADFAEV
jgi:hypothetical protein